MSNLEEEQIPISIHRGQHRGNLYQRNGFNTHVEFNEDNEQHYLGDTKKKASLFEKFRENRDKVASLVSSLFFRTYIFLTKSFEKLGNKIIARGKAEEDLRWHELALLFFKKYKRRIFLLAITSALFWYSYSYTKSIFREVFFVTYVDSYNNAIINPLIFVETEEGSDAVYFNQDITIFDDHYDNDLVAWLSNENKKGEQKLTEEDYARGYFVSRVYGFGEKKQTISFELLKKALVHLSKRFDGCVSAKNLGIPVDLIFLNMNPEQTPSRYMLQPEIYSESPSEAVIQYFIEIKNYGIVGGATKKVYHEEKIPEEIRVNWNKFTGGNSTKERRVTEKFSGEEALCIWYQNK